MADMPGRIILAVVAVALAAVTALELRAELDYQRGQALFSEVSQDGFAGDAADDIDRARDSLDRASDLRPGTTALVAHAFLEKNAGRPEEAAALAREATDREPDNVATWQALLSTSTDPAERARAQQELLALDPLQGQR